jgi:hypothetical protein
MSISPTPPFPAAYFETTKIEGASQYNNWYILDAFHPGVFSSYSPSQFDILVEWVEF